MLNEKVYPEIKCGKCKKSHNNVVDISNSMDDQEKPDTYVYECPHCHFKEEVLVDYKVYVVGKRKTKRTRF